ncbi:translocation/assembly module TamB domain-containing protein, partial [Thiotrichales bacterium HSG1]|nr:translocation/assembly module TamB domain-containing protein [Thiotrichales bacterium HSG1]
SGKIKLPKLTHIPPKGKQPITANLTAKFDDLDILPTFVPQAEDTKGKVGIDITVAGWLDNPKLKGKIQVIDVATELPDLGLVLKDFNLALHSDNSEKFYLDGGIRSGECNSADCQLNFKGQANLPSLTNWDAKININGNDFEVVNMPSAWVLISPDIDINLAPENIAVIGELLIPEAAFSPPKGSGGGAVAISKDVVFVDEIDEKNDKSVKKTGAGMQIATNVKVIFGDNITFEGAGLKSRLGGTLTASNEPGKATVGNGELWIDGTFKAYGQNLTINKGKIFFAGGPIENPGLDIRAFRKIEGKGQAGEEVVLAGGTRIRGDEDVISGVHINGTAQNLRMDLYSEPAMDESNKLSYIVLGKPAAQAGSGGGDLLLAAAAELPLSKSNALTNKIGSEFGLDEAGISTDDGVENAAFVLGKYLTPELYVSYGIGLFDGSNLLKMRYQLTKRWTLESETGTQSGVDLRYTLER